MEKVQKILYLGIYFMRNNQILRKIVLLLFIRTIQLSQIE